MKSIKAENIYRNYDKVQALDDISFDVNKGELFGFIGPDGAGKTTLFRILTTLILMDKGQATIEGLDVVKEYQRLRTILGYMPGRFSLYQDLTVEENLQFFASIFGTTIEENYDLIHDIYIQIEPFKDRLAGNLSGGMKQKLALSCAMIHKPKVLVLDEPTTGVDAVSRIEFWEMLKKLKNEGITIIVSTPYMNEAELCDKVALMQHGRIMKIARPDQIIKDYQENLYAVKTNNTYQLIQDLKQFSKTKTAFPFGQNVHFTPTDNSFEINDLSKYLTYTGHQNIGIEIIEPGVEDCFMALMAKEPMDKVQKS